MIYPALTLVSWWALCTLSGTRRTLELNCAPRIEMVRAVPRPVLDLQCDRIGRWPILLTQIKEDDR
jgi:hypothetical protein